MDRLKFSLSSDQLELLVAFSKSEGLAKLAEAMGKDPKISFIDTPIDIRNTYQYYTCASMDKLHEAGYSQAFHSLKEGVFDYVQGYLLEKRYF